MAHVALAVLVGFQLLHTNQGSRNVQVSMQIGFIRFTIVAIQCDTREETGNKKKRPSGRVAL